METVHHEEKILTEEDLEKEVSDGPFCSSQVAYACNAYCSGSNADGLFNDIVIFPPSPSSTNHQVHITLTETETIWLLDIPGTCVALDSEEAEQVKKKNEQYQEVKCGGCER